MIYSIISTLKSYLFFMGFANIDSDCDKYFNYKKYVNMRYLCENLLEEKNESIFDSLDIFSKNHYKYRNILYYNLQYLSIRYEEDLREKMSVVGYSYIDDEESIIAYSKIESIYHELLHLASSYYDKKNNIIHSGFYYADCNKNIIIGNGINEGYTEYLNIKEKFNGKCLNEIDYENRKIELPYYCYNSCLAEQLEIIIGKEKMEELYFNADLESLINILKKYKDKKEVYKFLKNVDYSIYGNDVDSMFIYKKIIDAQNFIFDIAKEHMKDKLDELEKIKIVNTMYLKDENICKTILPRKVINEYVQIEKDNRFEKKKVAMWN